MRTLILIATVLLAGCTSVRMDTTGPTNGSNHVQASCTKTDGSTYSDFECRQTVHAITYMMSCAGNTRPVFSHETITKHVYSADFVCR